MVEQQRHRLEREITNLVDDLDRSYLRNMQRDMHLCAVNCCDNKQLSIQDVQFCIEKCSKKLQSANDFIQKELSNYQNRVQRCIMDCNDEIRDKIGTSTSEQDMNKYERMFESCAVKCVDKHIGLLPNLLKSMKDVLSSSVKNKTVLNE